MHAQVAIVGAGPAGALLAHLLSSRGIETLLIERHSDFSREFRGEILMPSGIRALRSAGISLDGISTSSPARLEGYLNGQRFVDVDASSLGPLPPTAVSQPELLEKIVALSQTSGAFELRRGASVRGLTRESDGSISLRLATGGADGEETIRVPYLIGADGRSSIVRKNLAPRVQKRSTPLDVVWFKMPYPKTWEEGRLRFEFGNGHLLIAVRAPEGRLQVAWVILKGTYGELRKRGIEEWIDGMCRHADPELAAHLRDERQDVSHPFLLDAVTDRVMGWAGPSTLLIGDAAHTMSPVGGQGLNLALRDSIVSANVLVPALRRGSGVDEGARRVEALRGPEIDRIQRLAALPPRLMMGRSPLHELARRSLARIAALPFSGLPARRTASLFLDGVSEVELEI